MDEAIILFSVKDKDYFGMSNQYVADAFIMFKDIADITSDTGSIKQLHLKLTRPQNEGSFMSLNLTKLKTNYYPKQNPWNPSKLFRIELATSWQRSF